MSEQRHPSLPILIVDDEKEAIMACENRLLAEGMDHTLSCRDSGKLMGLLESNEVSLVLLDLRMPPPSGQELLPRIVEDHPDIPVIVMTGLNDLDTAVECMRLGAFDYLVKPVEEARFLSAVRRAVEMRELLEEYDSFRSRVLSGSLDHPSAFSFIKTQDPVLRSIFQYAETIARTKRPVLITGETGVGKELMARAIHDLSGRSGSFVAVNVASLDDSVFSDTLFGHQKGAFTDAGETRPGLIAEAEEGTLFLDEIGDIPQAAQVKLLRLLQEKEYLPLGSDHARSSDARIIVSTNRDLPRLVADRRFRNDLYYRLKTHQIQIPPLRNRLGDLPLLVDHFLERAAKELGKKKPAAPRGLYTLLGSYPFPGNIRELENMVFDAVSGHESRMLPLASFQKNMGEDRLPGKEENQNADAPSPFALFNELPTLQQVQALAIEEALRRTHGNQTQAARLLGISQPGLSKALKRTRS